MKAYETLDQLLPDIARTLHSNWPIQDRKIISVFFSGSGTPVVLPKSQVKDSLKAFLKNYTQRQQ